MKYQVCRHLGWNTIHFLVRFASLCTNESIILQKSFEKRNYCKDHCFQKILFVKDLLLSLVSTIFEFFLVSSYYISIVTLFHDMYCATLSSAVHGCSVVGVGGSSWWWADNDVFGTWSSNCTSSWPTQRVKVIFSVVRWFLLTVTFFCVQPAVAGGASRVGYKHRIDRSVARSTYSTGCF